jgi:lysophospholipase L1-like esterase
MRRRGNTRKPVLLCLGDSLTHGTMGASFTPDIPFKLSESLGLPPPTEGTFFFDPLWVVNAGQNCLTTHNVLTERLHSSLGCYPDFIMLMIGTNDVLSMHNSLIRKFYLNINQLPEEPSMQSFERNYTKILDHLWQSSPMSQVAVCTLPPLGENLDAPENRLIREANEIIHKVVANANGKVKMIPIYEKFQAILEKKKGKGTAVNSFIPIFISQCPLYYMTPDFLNWNKLSSLFGNTLLTDGLHFNERGRDEVVESVVDWLVNQANVAKAIAVKS